MPVDPSHPIIVTGCSSGIGRAIAGAAAAAGYTTYATARNVTSIADLAGTRTTVLPLDVTDASSARAVVEHAIAHHGRIGALVNNAGYALPGAVEDLDLDEIRREFETNVFGAIRLCQLVIPHMRSAGRGLIVNMSSMGGKLTFPGGGAYHASKHALEAFSDALRFETRGFGIDVVVMEPGLVRSSFGQTAHDQVRTASFEGPNGDFNRAVALSNVYAAQSDQAGSPEDVAQAVCDVLGTPDPRPRYRVLRTARRFMRLRALMTDRMWDRYMARLYNPPGRT